MARAGEPVLPHHRRYREADLTRATLIRQHVCGRNGVHSDCLAWSLAAAAGATVGAVSYSDHYAPSIRLHDADRRLYEHGGRASLRSQLFAKEKKWNYLCCWVTCRSRSLSSSGQA